MQLFNNVLLYDSVWFINFETLSIPYNLKMSKGFDYLTICPKPNIGKPIILALENVYVDFGLCKHFRFRDSS